MSSTAQSRIVSLGGTLNAAETRNAPKFLGTTINSGGGAPLNGCINAQSSTEEMVKFCNEKRQILTPPSQSSFRVYCIFVVHTDYGVEIVEGANCEQGYIGGAICAERFLL